MKFLNTVNKLFKNIGANKEESSEIEGTSDSKSKFPIWLLGGGLGCSIFAIAFVFIIIIAVLIYLGIIDVDLSSGSGYGGSLSYGFDSSCDYEATTVIVTDLSGNNVLATISLEDYIIGVACVEVGACEGASSYINEDYVKAQYVASKTYVLERGGYNSSDKTIKIRSSTADQGWCDLEKGCYMEEEMYTDGRSYHVFYPGSDEHPATKYFTEEDLETFHDWYQDIYGELFIKSSYSDKISSLPLSDSNSIAYKSTTQNFWEWMAKKGYTYDKILLATADPESYGYNSEVADQDNYANKRIYKLSSACSVVNRGSYANNYPLNGGSAKKLSEPITNILTSSEITAINNNIVNAVEEAGSGTGNGVAAAATELLMGLYNEGYYLPYYWGGGHSSYVIGVDTTWGDNVPSSVSNGGIIYNYKSLDCSGFVSWAIRNGACSSYTSSVASGFYNESYVIDFMNVTPGDVFVKTDNSHVILVIQNSGDGSVITAESTTNGVVFKNYTNSTLGSYYAIDMDSFYSNNCAF